MGSVLFKTLADFPASYWAKFIIFLSFLGFLGKLMRATITATCWEHLDSGTRKLGHKVMKGKTVDGPGESS